MGRKSHDKYIIDIHGKALPQSILKYLKIFSDLGYNVLSPTKGEAERAVLHFIASASMKRTIL